MIPNLKSSIRGKINGLTKFSGDWSIQINCPSLRLKSHIDCLLDEIFLKNKPDFRFSYVDDMSEDFLEEKRKKMHDIYPIGITSPFNPLFILFSPLNLKINIETVLKTIKWVKEWNPETYISAEEYHIYIGKFIQITSRSERGLYFGLQTLKKKFLKLNNGIPYQIIQDYPALSLRSIHIDLKKNCPNLQFLKDITRIISEYKTNSVIIEWEDKFPFEGELSIITSKAALSKKEKDEWLEYMYLHYIEAIPLVQSLGHFDYVLKHEKFRSLSELESCSCKTQKEKRLKYYMFCPSNPKSKEIIGKIHSQVTDGMGIHQKSRFVHIGMDETYFLGYCETCKNQLIQDEEKGKSQLFVNHLNWISSIYIEKGKRPIVWCDMIVKHPQLVNKIDKKVIINEWNYEHPLPLKSAPLSKRIQEIDPTGNSVDWVYTWNSMDLKEILKKTPPNSVYFLDNYWKIKNRKYPLSAFPYTRFFKDKGFQVLASPAVQSGRSTPFITNYTQYLSNIIHFNAFASRHDILGSFLTNWVVRDSLWPTLMFGFITHAETSWSGEIVSSEDISERFWCEFFGLDDIEISEDLDILKLFFGIIGYLSFEYDLIFRQLSESIGGQLNLIDKNAIESQVKHMLPKFNISLGRIGKKIIKNKPYFESLKISLEYQIFLIDLLDIIPKIERIALDFDEGNLEFLPNADEMEILADSLVNLRITLRNIEKQLSNIHEWHLQKAEIASNYEIRIKPPMDHIQLVEAAFIPFKECLDNFIHKIISNKFGKL